MNEPKIRKCLECNGSGMALPFGGSGIECKPCQGTGQAPPQSDAVSKPEVNVFRQRVFGQGHKLTENELKFIKPTSDAGAELKTKISGASGFERGASCVKCLKPLSTTRGGGQPEDFWHEYYKDIITQINDDNQKLMSEKDKRIAELTEIREKIKIIALRLKDISTAALKKGE